MFFFFRNFFPKCSGSCSYVFLLAYFPEGDFHLQTAIFPPIGIQKKNVLWSGPLRLLCSSRQCSHLWRIKDLWNVLVKKKKIFSGTEVWTQDLCWLVRCFTTWVMPPVSFCCLSDMISRAQGQLRTSNPPPCSSHAAGITGMNRYTWIIGWDGGLANFYHRMALNCNHPNLYLQSREKFFQQGARSPFWSGQGSFPLEGTVSVFRLI
jgi:hypothetical protein